MAVNGSFKGYKKEMLKDPEVKATYDAMEPAFQMARSFIEARVEQGLTQKQVAIKAGVTQHTIAQLESGIANPTIKTISLVAKALGKELELVAR